MSLAKLTSVSTQTLSLLLERQRSMSMGQSAPNVQTQQILRNLNNLRSGILEFERSPQQGGNRDSKEACRLLRSQFERMRGMLGDDGDAVELLSPPEEVKPSETLGSSSTPSPPAPKENPFIPYSDEAPPSPDRDPSEMLQEQQLLMNQQDAHLDNLALSVGRQRDISIQINDELSTHTGLLEALDEDLDNTGNRLTNARRRLDKFSRGVKGNWSSYTIAGLILILLILIIIFKT
ncbi:hypothetical protein SCHPADRAFT_899863 [Schizopora paradoxa]|uniref:t-SNARE coiled-coil homology domain-containing protein n=1 Tax=Schizopora paradoxa TaxID=27342 RepID=A0A0H2S975_9AGAM|nr:hypothetical protein SCHPADRAFT_899863 [Schizopora paradoxa]